MTVHTPSRACYQRGCKREECEQANYRYAKRLALEHARGERRLHDATQVRAHIQRLLAKKWWQAEIARVSGVSDTTIGLLLNGQAFTSKATALAILSIPVVEISRTERGERLDPTGSIRRLQALAVIGHTWTVISGPTGMTTDRLGSIARGITDGIRPDEARKIAAVYRRLSTTPGESKQIATGARNKGWHGPLAWDDIDNPDCQPETERRSRSKNGGRGKGFIDLDRVAHLTAVGKSAGEIAMELGCHQRSVVRARRRAEMAVAA
ncbi:MAG TPA: hypothetical protein VGL02_32000 [Streptomyces sp.]